jgi:hypothetical protein
MLMIMLRFGPILLLTLLSACAQSPTPIALGFRSNVSASPAALDGISPDWKAIMLPGDATRLAALEGRWTTTLADLRATSFQQDVEGEGALLDPAAALARPAPPPGRYKCRVVRLGKAATGPAFERFKSQFCFVEVEGDLLTFVKGTGSRRPGGRLWEDGDRRLVFIGATPLGDEQETPAYGASVESNTVGVVERVGDFIWRMATPGPDRDDQIEVIELVPDTPIATTATR